MVEFESEANGLVTLRVLAPADPGDEAGYLAALERIGACEENFALLACFSSQGILSQAGERAQALWYKATRAQMNRTCRAIALVRPGESGARSAEIFGKLWSFPVAGFAEEAPARAFLRPFLEAGR